MNNAGAGKTGDLRGFPKIKSIDIPQRVADELERLHDVVKENGGSANKESREWAMKKIDRIHELFFHGKMVVSNE